MAAQTKHFARVLVPVDFTPASDELIEAGTAWKVGNHYIDFAPASVRSIELAASVVRGSGGELRLIHATPTLQYSQMYAGPAGVSVPASVVKEIHDRARSTSIEALEQLVAKHCGDIKASYEARPGVPVNLVLEEAERYDADLIVMAASGRSRVTRFFLGSTADRVIRQAGCPVLVVPSHERK